MVRIRYELVSESRLVSKPIESTAGLFRTEIERDSEGTFHYFAARKVNIDGEEGWVMIKEGRSRNLTVAKNKAKAFLKAEGVQFLDEVRRRGERSVNNE